MTGGIATAYGLAMTALFGVGRSLGYARDDKKTRLLLEEKLAKAVL